MATTTATLTPSTDQTPAVVSVSNELSGAQWCGRFPGSASTDDLDEPFRSKALTFLAAISAAGAHYHVFSTYRPRPRQYLMHYCVKVATGEMAASAVPPMDGVNINWVHPTNEESISAARAMQHGYQIVFPPAVDSNHSRKLALDMHVNDIVGKDILNASGQSVHITHLPDLNPVGATYGVIKLVSDPPHWSIDGH